jgi:hypothetical protein
MKEVSYCMKLVYDKKDNGKLKKSLQKQIQQRTNILKKQEAGMRPHPTPPKGRNKNYPFYSNCAIKVVDGSVLVQIDFTIVVVIRTLLTLN